MLSLLGVFSRASAKLAATFVVVIILMILAFAVAPGAIVGLQDMVEDLNEMLRNPPLNQQATVLYRTLVNENTIFGILMTLIARAIVETCAFGGGRAWKAMRGDTSNAG